MIASQASKNDSTNANPNTTDEPIENELPGLRNDLFGSKISVNEDP